MQPDLLSDRIEEFRAWFARYATTGVAIAPEAMIAYDALFAEFVKDARAIEQRAANFDGLGARCATALADTAAAIERAEQLRADLDGGRPLNRIVAEIDAEARATNAMAASIRRTKLRLVDMRAAQDRAGAVVASEQAVLAGVESGKVALFPARNRSLGLVAPNGDVPVEQALAFIADVTRDAPKSRFAADVSRGDRNADAPTFDNSGDCA